MANELVDPNKNFGHIIRFVYAKQLLELMRWSLESSLFNRRLLRRFINKKKHVKTSLSNFNEPFYRREIITFMCITGLVCLPFIDVAFAEIKPSCKSKNISHYERCGLISNAVIEHDENKINEFN